MRPKHHPDLCKRNGCKSCLYRKEIRCQICNKKQTLRRAGKYCGYKCRRRAENARRYKKLKAIKELGMAPQTSAVQNHIGEPCTYCGTPIGSLVRYKGKIKRLRGHIDHFEPVASGGITIAENLFLSCHLCNSIKNCSVFKCVDDFRKYILAHYEKNGWELLGGPLEGSGV